MSAIVVATPMSHSTKRAKKRQRQQQQGLQNQNPEFSAQAAARTAASLQQYVASVSSTTFAAHTEQHPPSQPAPPTSPIVAAGSSSKSSNTEDSKSSKRKLNEAQTTTTTERYSQFGGVSAQIEEIQRVIEFPLRYPQVFTHLGSDPPTGVLLHGPPGCGKSKLCHAIAGELGLPFFRVSAPELVAGVSGESEQKVRTLFQTAKAASPSLLFIDEIDAIAGKRDSAVREMERRIVAQLLSCMDDLASLWKEQKKICIVLGATNRPDALDPALRRAGRFDREICMGIPNLEGRREILAVLTKPLKLAGAVDLNSIAFRTPGFVGADLHALTKEASTIALRRIFNLLYPKAKPPPNPDPDPLAGGPSTISSPALDPSQVSQILTHCAITMQDFDEAVGKVQPSAMREGFTTIPSVTWADVGALEDVKAELVNNVAKPIMYPGVFQAMGCLANPIGILLYGPPGCGKTLVAKAIANESGANFISIKGPELLNKYVGETERAVRTVFARAAASAPCILFFDELDALAPRRGNESGNQAGERVVNQLLTELDGVKARLGVYVIAATNRVDMIDPAMLRPGRFDKMLYVPLPSAATRGCILRTLSRGVPVAGGVSVEQYAEDERCEGFSGADLAALIREAAVASVTEYFESQPPLTGTVGPHHPPLTPLTVTNKHLETALQKIKPSVSERDRLRYERMKSSLSQNT